MTAPVILKLTRDFAAPAARVFDAWLNPVDAARFLFATPNGEMLRCDIDARVGGGFTLTERRPAGDAEHRGRYLTIERPHRLVFLFAADPADEGEWTRVTIEIAEAPGGCTLTLIHEMDPQWAPYEAQTRKGWTTILEGLARIMENAHG
jgi:uncharacterized protein YndB with AHSA1/START domain